MQLSNSSIFQFLSNRNIFQSQFKFHNKSRFAIHMVAEYLQIHMEQVLTEYALRMDVHENRRIIMDFERFYTKNFYFKMNLIRHFSASCIMVQGS